MAETDVLANVTSSIKNFGETICVQVAHKNNKENPDVGALEALLYAAVQRLRAEIDKDLNQLLEDVAEKRPPEGTPADDPQSVKYMELIQETTEVVQKTTSWVDSAMSKIRELITSVIDKIKKKIRDIISFIRDQIQKIVQ